MDVDRRGKISALALAGLTVGAGLGFLSRQTFTVERCFRTTTMSGCDRPVYPFSLEALPSLILPLFIILLVAALIWSMAMAADSLGVAASGSLAAIGVALLSLVGGFVLLVPFLVGLGIAVVRLGERRRPAAIDVLGCTLTCAAGVLAAYGVLVGAMHLRGGFLGGSAPMAAIYVAYGAAVGVGLGLARADQGSTTLPLTRGMAVAVLAAGLAGTLALLLVPPIPGRGIITLGVPLLAGLGIATGTVGARWLYAMSWGSALALAIGVVVAFALFLGVSLLLLFGFSGPLTLMPPLPNVPYLPGTSTGP